MSRRFLDAVLGSNPVTAPLNHVPEVMGLLGNLARASYEPGHRSLTGGTSPQEMRNRQAVGNLMKMGTILSPTPSFPQPSTASTSSPSLPENRQNDDDDGFAGGSFKGMIEETRKMHERGEEIPFQNFETMQDVRDSFNRQSPGGQRQTGWDLNSAYQVVNKLTNQDYAELKSVTDPVEFFDKTSDTTLNLLEESGYTFSDEQEASFKAGIQGAMNEWYAREKEEGRPVTITTIMMAQTQIALSYLSMGQQGTPTPNQTAVTSTPETGATSGLAPTGAERYVGSPAGYLDPQFVLENQGNGQVSPETLSGIQHIMEQTGMTYEEVMALQAAQAK